MAFIVTLRQQLAAQKPRSTRSLDAFAPQRTLLRKNVGSSSNRYSARLALSETSKAERSSLCCSIAFGDLTRRVWEIVEKRRVLLLLVVASH
jgi:hypothetical protein